MWFNLQNKNDVPLVSLDWRHWIWNIMTTDEIRAILLMPPASIPAKWHSFQQRLSNEWIHSDIIVNRGTEMRLHESYSFSWMCNDLLAVLSQARESYPQQKLLLSSSCLSTIVLALALPEIYRKNLVDWIIVGIPTSSLEYIASVHNTTLPWIQTLYQQAYNLNIDLSDIDDAKNISPIQQLFLFHSKSELWKPFIYFNNFTKYIEEKDKDMYIEGVVKKVFTGIVFDTRKNSLDPLFHNLENEDIPYLEEKTISYMKNSFID